MQLGFTLITELATLLLCDDYNVSLSQFGLLFELLYMCGWHVCLIASVHLCRGHGGCVAAGDKLVLGVTMRNENLGGPAYLGIANSL